MEIKKIIVFIKQVLVDFLWAYYWEKVHLCIIFSITEKETRVKQFKIWIPNG